ncbi:hypothetical protein ACUH9X_08260 [Dermabacteraceae bacterium P13147]
MFFICLLGRFGGGLASLGGGSTFTSDSIVARLGRKIAIFFILSHTPNMRRTPESKAPTPQTEGSRSNNSGGITINIYGGEHSHYYGPMTSQEPSFGSQPPGDEEPGWWSVLAKLLAQMRTKLRSEIASWLAGRLLGSLIWFGVVCVGAGASAFHELGGFWSGIIRASMKVGLLLMQ